LAHDIDDDHRHDERQDERGSIAAEVREILAKKGENDAHGNWLFADGAAGEVKEERFERGPLAGEEPGRQVERLVRV